MLKTDPGLTTELPVWLITCAAIILVGRIALFFYEHAHPPAPSDEIHWQKVAAHEPKSNDTDKMILYYFTSNWSGSVRKLEANAFSNREIVKYINDNFQPKKIVDLSVEEKTNEPQIQKLEDKYGLSSVKVFPKLIVTLPDGTEVTRSIGARNSVLIQKFLEDSIKTEGFIRSKQMMKEENWEKAADLYDQYLKKNGLKADRSIYAIIREYICLRMISQRDQARSLLKTDFEGTDPTHWPYPVLAFLCNAIDEKELLKRTGDVQDHRMEMHAYLGTALYLAGDLEKARIHLKQSTVDVRFKDWLEYQLANSVLKRMGGVADSESAASSANSSTTDTATGAANTGKSN